MRKQVRWLRHEIEDFKILMRNVPSSVVALFTVSVILMNLLANREIEIPISWLTLDCGFFISWLSFLSMDMLTKRFGAKASIKISVFALGCNLLMCLILFFVIKVPGVWGEYYTFRENIVNTALDNTFSGSWYVLMGSSVAFLVSAIVNSILNESIGKMLKSNNFRAFALRSYISTMVGQFVDNMIFAWIVSHTFFGWTPLQCIICSITGCFAELICEIIFSPLGYKANKAWERDNVGSQYFRWRAKSATAESQIDGGRYA